MRGSASSVRRSPSRFPSLCSDSEMPRPAKMSPILPTPITGSPAATIASHNVGSGGTSE